LPTFVQVTRVAALTVSENGLKEPPPPEIVTLASAIGLQAGEGLGLGEALGEGLGLGEGVCASEMVVPAMRRIVLMITAARRTPNGCFVKLLIIIFSLVPFVGAQSEGMQVASTNGW
jgi:hypothetical protein